MNTLIKTGIKNFYTVMDKCLQYWVPVENSTEAWPMHEEIGRARDYQEFVESRKFAQLEISEQQFIYSAASERADRCLYM